MTKLKSYHLNSLCDDLLALPVNRPLTLPITRLAILFFTVPLLTAFISPRILIVFS
ncbi:MAG: hypothetical protein MKZ96_06315 [Candidatus Atelocyanobacterium sp. ALOHA_A2.5_9]|nr:hypothetical protein [Candidatus Atelocyanobacterium sp. ALOHA_A2.5_9]